MLGVKTKGWGKYKSLLGNKLQYRMGKKLSLKVFQELAVSKGGKCLSKKYVNVHSELHWMCDKGHKWDAKPIKIKNGGQWCPYCSGHRGKTVQTLRELAKSRGGECLSKKYLTAHSKYKWKCSSGHTWEASFNNVRKGHWCGDCGSGLGERVTRAYFQQVFGRNFPKARPDWLINSRGNQMEFDGYCRALGIAFEHQGLHHSQKSFFHRKRDSLDQRKSDDRRKAKLAKLHGVALFSVPEIPRKLKIDDFPQWLTKEAKRKKVKLPRNIENQHFDLKEAFSVDKLQPILDIVEGRGGKCLSKEYVHQRHMLKFKCEEGHRFEMTADSIKAGKWCRTCGIKTIGDKKRKYSIDDMRKFAKKLGGYCLSKSFKNSKEKLKWKCRKGHSWEANFSNIKNGKWCPTCGRVEANRKKRADIKEIRKIAMSKGGKVLSKTYEYGGQKLDFVCKKGHEFKASGRHVVNGVWCRKCAQEATASSRRLGVELISRLAKQKGGECISKSYTNARTPMKFRCSDGHNFKMTPAKLRLGRWCKLCVKNIKIKRKAS